MEFKIGDRVIHLSTYSKGIIIDIKIIEGTYLYNKAKTAYYIRWVDRPYVSSHFDWILTIDKGYYTRKNRDTIINDLLNE